MNPLEDGDKWKQLGPGIENVVPNHIYIHLSNKSLVLSVYNNTITIKKKPQPEFLTRMRPKYPIHYVIGGVFLDIHNYGTTSWYS